MTKQSNNDDESPEAFDDILFSSTESKENATEALSESKKDTPSFSDSEGFDDVLFGDEATVEKAFAQTAADKATAKEEQVDEPAAPTMEPVKVKNKAPVLDTLPSKPKHLGAVTSIDEPVADDCFLEGALFSDDDDYPDESSAARPKPNDDTSEASDDAELMQDALFTSTEDFEQATDYHPEKVIKKEKVALPVEKSEENPVIAGINTDFQSFVTRSSQADAFIAKAPSLQKQLIAENDAINDSFPRMLVDAREAIGQPDVSIKEPEPEPEEETSKVSLFARKAKSGVNDFLGGTIEERVIALDFKLPRQHGIKDVGKVPSKKDIQAYLDKKGAKTLTLLKHSEYDISLISKHNLSASERIRLLETFLPMMYDKIPNLILSFERKPFDPKNTDRFEQLTLSLDSLRGLIVGYRQIYVAFYEMNNFNYKRKQEEANQCAYELVQLLYLEMQLMQASKIPLPASSIKSINKIALVLKRYEPEFFTAVQQHSAHKKPRSIETLWKKYQLYLCFDHLSMSSKLNTALDNYLDFNVLDKTELLTLDEAKHCTHSQLIFVQGSTDRRGKLLALEDMSADESAAEFEKLTVDEGSVFLAVDALFNQIKRDYLDCFLLLTAAKKIHGCEALESLGREEILCLFSYLNQQIEQVEENNKKPFYSIYTATEMEVRTGLTDISNYYHALVDQWNEDLKGPQGGPQNKSSQFGHKGWGIANETADEIFLQGTLQASTPYLDCGEVICVSRKDENGLLTHQLAVIKELNLSNLHQPQIVAAKIAEDIAGLYSTDSFKPEHGRETMNNFPVLNDGMLCVKDKQHFLLVSTDSALSSDALLRVCLADQSSFIINTNQLHFISPATMLFSLA